MTGRSRRVLMTAIAAAFVAGVAGCAETGEDAKTDDKGSVIASYTPEPVSTTTEPAPAETGRTYRLTRPLCDVVDVGPLTDVFPAEGGEPLAETVKLCNTSRRSPTVTVGFVVDADLWPSERMSRMELTETRRRADNPTDLPGVGSAAYWTGDAHRVKVMTYDGNLVLSVTCFTVDNKQELPEGMAERLGRVADGTLARLAR